MNPDDLLGLVEGAPWPVKVIVGLLIVTAPGWLPYLATRKKAAPTSSLPEGQGRPATPEDDEDEDVRELRDSLISVLQKLQKAERQVEVLTESLANKDAELQQERAQTRTLTTELAEVRGEVARLQGLFEMVIQQRGSMPPPSAL